MAKRIEIRIASEDGTDTTLLAGFINVQLRKLGVMPQYPNEDTFSRMLAVGADEWTLGRSLSEFIAQGVEIVLDDRPVPVAVVGGNAAVPVAADKDEEE